MFKKLTKNFSDRKLLKMPANILMALCWLCFPLGIVTLCVKKDELKYYEKVQLISSFIVSGLIVLINIVLQIFKYFVWSGTPVFCFVFVLPLYTILLVSIIRCVKNKYYSFKLLTKFASLFLDKSKMTEEDSIVLHNELELKEGTKSIVSSVISIIIGLIVGFIVMLIISIVNKDNTIRDAFDGIVLLVKGPFASTNAKYVKTLVGDTIFYAVPLIMTGLSVAIAYKTGLFNIGAPGQYIMGTIGALLVALYIPYYNEFTRILVWILAIVVAMLMGMIWGVIPGFLKAKFNINEVIICIMTNWSAANVASWIFSRCKGIISKENTKGAYLMKPLNSTPKFGFDKLFPGSYLDFGIIVAILLAIFIFILLNKTTLGYELKACGGNKEAAKYAGLKSKRNIVLSMVIAGGLAGIGAALYFLNAGIEYKFESQYSSLPAYGFNGIASAFLANCNPIGTIFSSLFIRYISTGGQYLSKANFNMYISDIVISFIIYIAGFTRIIREFITKKLKNNNEVKDTRYLEIQKPTENDLNKEEIVNE